MLVWLHTDKPIKHTIFELHPKLGMCFRNKKKEKKETCSILDGCLLPAEKTAFQGCWSPGADLYQ